MDYVKYRKKLSDSELSEYANVSSEQQTTRLSLICRSYDVSINVVIIITTKLYTISKKFSSNWMKTCLPRDCVSATWNLNEAECDSRTTLISHGDDDDVVRRIETQTLSLSRFKVLPPENL